MVSEMCFLNNTKSQLEADLAEREKTIKNLKSQVKDLEVELILKEEKQTKKLKELERVYEEKYSQYEEMQVQKV